MVIRRTVLAGLRRGLGGILASCLVFGASNALAQWPDKPINMIVPYGAGGSVDYIARLLGPRLGKALGQEIIVKNVGGASGAIGAMQVVRSDPDGYTLMLGSGSEVAIAWAVNPRLNYNGIKDLAAVSLVATSPMVVVGNNGIPAKDLKGLLHYARDHPGKLSLATSGVGTPQHLLLEYIDRRAKVDILHIPYRSAGSIMSDLIGGRVDLSILTLTTALAQVEAGKLRAYALTGKTPSDLMPNVPVLDAVPELAGADFSLWFGLLAPRGTPRAVVDRLNIEVSKILSDPGFQKGLEAQGLIVGGGSPAQFADFIERDSEKYQRIIKAAHIEVN